MQGGIFQSYLSFSVNFLGGECNIGGGGEPGV